MRKNKGERRETLSRAKKQSKASWRVVPSSNLTSQTPFPLFPYKKNSLLSLPASQASFLRELNRRGDPEAVISLYERGAVSATPGALGEYMKALVKADRLDSAALLRTLEGGGGAAASSSPSSSAMAAAAPFAARPSFYGQQFQQASSEAATPGFGFFGGGGGGGGGGSSFSSPAAAASALSSSSATAAAAAPLGSASNPLVTMAAEPSARAQLWRTLRTLGLALVLVSGVGALVDAQGGLAGGGRGGAGVLHNPDLRPQSGSPARFDDVKGVDEAKHELSEVVEFLRDPSKFTALGGKLPKGVLLVGPPGTGKTLLARAVAGEAGVPFFYASGSEFEEMFVGVGARRVRDLFAAARKAAPCIVFIDEVDAIGGARNPKDQQYMKMTLNQLLVELDGFKPADGVIVVAATNFPESLDKALVRPGRFDRHVSVPNPDIRGREAILEAKFAGGGVPRDADVDLSLVARGTPGFSGADLANLVNLAALDAARAGAKAVGARHLDAARDRIMMGAERKSAALSPANRRLTAYHEGGHALVALRTEGAHPLHKATIVPRGMALGMVTQLPDDGDDGTSVTRMQLLAKLDVCMGGRVAEELVFGPGAVTTGASSDLEQATRLARAMVTKFGMSERLGAVSIPYGDSAALSPETRAAVEAEVKALLAAAYDRASKVLKRHEADLHALAAALLDRETLSGGEIAELVGQGAVNSEACSRLAGRGREKKKSSSRSSSDNESSSSGSGGGSDGGKGVTAAQGEGDKARRPVQPGGAVAPAASVSAKAG